MRRRDVAPLVSELIEWMKREQARLPGHNPVAKALSYTLKRGDVFTRFLHDGRICLSNKCGDAALRRGFGPVKEKAVQDAKARTTQLAADLVNPPPAPRQIAAE